MAKFLEDAQNPEFQQVLEQAFRELGTDGTDRVSGLLLSIKLTTSLLREAEGENIHSLLGALSTNPTPAAASASQDDGDDVSLGVAKTLQNMAKAAEDMEGLDTGNLESMGEDMMAEMMKKFETMGEKVRYCD